MARRLVVVDVRRLLAALLVDHCALDGIFFKLVDSDHEEMELAQVIVLHGWCCGRTRPWMQVRITGNRGGAHGDQRMLCGPGQHLAGGLTAAFPVASGAEYLVTGGLKIRLAAGADPVLGV
ncbi:hypothetical protein JKP88DRAFT_275592 [Tribonema minus]|uniref:Uncharacterized protein n=1 Tax=Tribonema minus TaxID=303371 RepID=A0A835ZHP0_9STRA|nr:hypothetical protein JKP88DRAFT_275592 [Tribonema minus]